MESSMKRIGNAEIFVNLIHRNVMRQIKFVHKFIVFEYFCKNRHKFQGDEQKWFRNYFHLFKLIGSLPTLKSNLRLTFLMRAILFKCTLTDRITILRTGETELFWDFHWVFPISESRINLQKLEYL